MKYFIIFLFLFGFFQVGTSQNAEEYFSYLQGLENSGQHSKAEYLKGIYKNLIPTMYFENGELKTYGPPLPQRLLTNNRDVYLGEKAIAANYDMSNVEIIIIKYKEGDPIGQLNLDPAFVQSLTALKYIVFVTAYDVQISKFDEIVPQLPSNVKRLVRISFEE